AEKKAREKGGGAINPPAADASAEDQGAFYTEFFERPKELKDVTVAPTLPEGEEYTDDERSVLQGVVGMMHQAGVFGKKQIEVGAQILTDMLVGGRVEMGKMVTAKQEKTKAALAKAWGASNVEANLTYANNYAAHLCEEAGVKPEALANLRLQDGSRLG